jgi:hypothetical protein
MATTTISQLSPEILHLIVYNVFNHLLLSNQANYVQIYQEDEPLYSIKKCSLVSRYWYEITKRFIFRRVTLAISSTSIYTLDYVDLLLNRPDLQRIIRIVHIKVQDNVQCPLTLEKSIQALIPNLAALRSIE